MFLIRRASIWSDRTLVRFFSALALWMYSIRTRLFLKTLPLAFWYSEWYLHGSIVSYQEIDKSQERDKR